MQIIIGIIGAIIVSLSAGTYVQSWRLHAAQAEVKSLSTQLDMIKEFAAKEKKDKETKLGEANVKYKTVTDELNATIGKLRKQSTVANTKPFLPDRSSTVPSSKNVCFDRAEFNKAQSDSEREIEELAIEGTKAIVDLQCGVNWAN